MQSAIAAAMMAQQNMNKYFIFSALFFALIKKRQMFGKDVFYCLSHIAKLLELRFLVIVATCVIVIVVFTVEPHVSSSNTTIDPCPSKPMNEFLEASTSNYMDSIPVYYGDNERSLKPKTPDIHLYARKFCLDIVNPPEYELHRVYDCIRVRVGLCLDTPTIPLELEWQIWSAEVWAKHETEGSFSHMSRVFENNNGSATGPQWDFIIKPPIALAAANDLEGMYTTVYIYATIGGEFVRGSPLELALWTIGEKPLSYSTSKPTCTAANIEDLTFGYFDRIEIFKPYACHKPLWYADIACSVLKGAGITRLVFIGDSTVRENYHAMARLLMDLPYDVSTLVVPHKQPTAVIGMTCLPGTNNTNCTPTGTHTKYYMCYDEVRLEFYEYGAMWDIAPPLDEFLDFKKTVLFHNFYPHGMTPDATYRITHSALEWYSRVYDGYKKRGLRIVLREAYPRNLDHRTAAEWDFNRRLHLFAKEANIPVIQTQKMIDADPLKYVDEYHLNGDFNEAVAQVLVTLLRDLR